MLVPRRPKADPPLAPVRGRHVPALVLLPGMDGSGELFAPFVAALGAGVETIVVRYPDRPLGYASHEWIARAALPKDRPFVVLGESFSGPIAISIAASAPRGMLGYVLCASYARCPRLLMRAMRPLMPLLTPQGLPRALLETLLMGRFASPELRRSHAEALRRLAPATLVARLEAVADLDIRHKLELLNLPGLCLRASEDRLVPARATRTLARLAPQAQVLELPGPHMLLQANPEAAAGAVSQFLHGLEARAEKSLAG